MTEQTLSGWRSRPGRAATAWRSDAFGRLAPAATVLLGFYACNWISIAPNRLLPGQGVPALAALGPMVHVGAAGLVLALALGTITSERGPLMRLAPITLLIILASMLVVLTGVAATPLLVGRPPAARVMVAAGGWLSLAGLLATIAGEARRTGIHAAAPVALGLVVLIAAAAAYSGWLDALSLAREIRARADLLGAAMRGHIALSAGALGLGLAAALPLGWAAFRSPRVEALTSVLLQGVQVVPAMALLAALVPALSFILAAFPALRGVGLAAIGPAPALIGVAAYLALPLVSSLVAGLRLADAAVIEAARAMGMTEARLTREVRIPLGMPLLVAGLRVGAVQSIGLTTLGGLVGAGGLGAIVFEGMAQFAPDLILLGAAPIVLLALAVDSGLRTLGRRLRGPQSEP